MGGINHNTIAGRREQDLARAIAQPPAFEPVTLQLFKVTSATLITGSASRYLYGLRRARVGNSPGYAPAVTSDSHAENGLSVSELSNAGATWSYGIVKATVPAGFGPVAIPVDSYVIATPHRTDNGGYVWLIINTQAIDGECP